jgi:cell division protein FtsB
MLGRTAKRLGMSSRAYAGRAPRRRVRRRVGPSRIRWDRVGRIALVLVLFGVLVSYLNPLVNLVHAWSDSKAGEERLAELRQENSELQEQVREASSPLTLEREARRLGMVKAGEHAYVIRGLD